MVGLGGQPAVGREEPGESAEVDSEAVCDPEAGGGGSVQEGEVEDSEIARTKLAPQTSRLKGGCSQDWLPHSAASRNLDGKTD